MRMVYWLLALALVGLAISIPVTARGAELSALQVGACERGLAALAAGDHEGAFELLRSVPRRDPGYARAMRSLGWDILAEQRGDTRGALPYVDAALLADPFSGEVWSAWGRLHLRLVGLGR